MARPFISPATVAPILTTLFSGLGISNAFLMALLIASSFCCELKAILTVWYSIPDSNPCSSILEYPAEVSASSIISFFSGFDNVMRNCAGLGSFPWTETSFNTSKETSIFSAYRLSLNVFTMSSLIFSCTFPALKGFT